jgi:hypothetical protein
MKMFRVVTARSIEAIEVDQVVQPFNRDPVAEEERTEVSSLLSDL